MLRKAIAILSVAFVLGVSVALIFEPSRTQIEYVYVKVRGGYSVDDRLQQFGEDVAERLTEDFKKAGVSYPPKEVTYIAFKDSNRLELYARSFKTESWSFIRTYPVLKASGVLGPKLREGDRQVPEGIYRSESLNPNSQYHLSIRVNYPNEFDQRMARSDGRERLGGDIMIHGSSVSIGCLAMGNIAAEDLFVLVALADSAPAKIVISPTDFRINPDYAASDGEAWLTELYDQLRAELHQFKKESNHSLQGRQP